METALPLEAFASTDVVFTARLNIYEITLDNLSALIELLQTVVEQSQLEIQARAGTNVKILPIVSVTGGSVVVTLKLKASAFSAELKVTVSDVFVAAVLALSPNAVSSGVSMPPPKLSLNCFAAIEQAHRDAQASWQYFGRDVEAQYTATCGTMQIRSNIKVPAAKRRR